MGWYFFDSHCIDEDEERLEWGRNRGDGTRRGKKRRRNGMVCGLL